MNASSEPALPEISASVREISDLYELGGSCYADYTVELNIGAEQYLLEGWKLCGWLRPGAHADLDGSGLALWGSAQPGGWTSCSTDGSCNGTPRIKADTADYEADIVVGDVEGRRDARLYPSVWPAWEAAVENARRCVLEAKCADANLRDCCDDPLLLSRAAREVDAAEMAGEEAETFASALRQRLLDAIQAALPGPPEIPEPGAESVFDELDETEIPSVRFGDFLGAGLALAWATDDGYRMTWWPDESDILRAVEDVSADFTKILAAQMQRVYEKLDEQ